MHIKKFVHTALHAYGRNARAKHYSKGMHQDLLSLGMLLYTLRALALRLGETGYFPPTVSGVSAD